MTSTQRKALVLVGGAGLVASVGLISVGHIAGVEDGMQNERNRITQDLRAHQYSLLHDAEFVYRDTPKQDSLLRDAHSVEYVLKRLQRVRK